MLQGDVISSSMLVKLLLLALEKLLSPSCCINILSLNVPGVRISDTTCHFHSLIAG